MYNSPSLSFLDKQYNSFQGDVEKDNLGIGVLAYFAYSPLKEFTKLHNIRLVDKPRKVL